VSILVIRQHARYAVCRKAQLSRAESRPVSGLLVELSLHGCRLGNIDERRFALDETVTLKIPGFDGFEGQVRWVGEGVVGLRFRNPFHAPALERLIRACRGETQRVAPLRAYA
jgi:hypothetical protein